MATKKEPTPVLVPKLRFPEFQVAEGWSEELLEDLLAMPATYGIVTAGEFQQGGVPMLRGGDIKDGKVGNGLPFVSEDIHFQYRRTVLQANDVVLALVGYPGEAAVVPREYIGANISRAVGLLRLKDVQGSRFLVCYLNSPIGRQTVLKPSAGSAQVVVNLKDLNTLVIPVPKPSEQLRIAECLGSVDEVITAQAQKLNALKTHRKGLMQRLFPLEGETQPSLRFPQFQDTGEWVQKKIGDVSDVLMCKRIFAEETNPNEGVPFYKIGTLGGDPDAFISKERFEDYKSRYNFPRKGEVLITCSGTVGKCLPYDGKDAYFQDSNIVWLDNPTCEVSNAFLLVLLSKVDWGGLNSTTITRIYGPDLRGVSIKFPGNENEQEHIVACLSALEDLITAETQKHDALRAHKRGLMQQLFPRPETIKA